MPAICSHHGWTNANPEGDCWCGRPCEFPAFACECGWSGDEAVLVRDWDWGERVGEIVDASFHKCPSCGTEVEEG